MNSNHFLVGKTVSVFAVVQRIKLNIQQLEGTFAVIGCDHDVISRYCFRGLMVIGTEQSVDSSGIFVETSSALHARNRHNAVVLGLVIGFMQAFASAVSSTGALV